MPNGGDLGGDLMAGQLPAFTRLRALGDFDLELVGRNKIFRSHTEAGRRDLLDSAVCEIAARSTFESVIVFAAFAAVALGAKPVHRDGQSFVRLFRKRAERHSRRRETRQHAFGGFDLIEHDRVSWTELN